MHAFTEALYSIKDILEKADSLGECKTRLTVFIPLFLIIINLIVFASEKEGIYLPFREVCF